MRTRPTIQAVDDPESTFYVLMRPGHEPVTADWPHPLLELAPDAVRLPSVTTITGHGTNYSKSSIVVSVAMNTEWVSPITQERRDLLAHRRRLAALKAWRAARPGRFLRTGRKRAKNAFVSEEELREVHSRHWVGFQSLRSISKERWQEWGYSSANTCMNSIHQAIKAYGLRTHDQRHDDRSQQPGSLEPAAGRGQAHPPASPATGAWRNSRRPVRRDQDPPRQGAGRPLLDAGPDGAQLLLRARPREGRRSAGDLSQSAI